MNCRKKLSRLRTERRATFARRRLELKADRSKLSRILSACDSEASWGSPGCHLSRGHSLPRGGNPVLPPPYATPSVTNHPRVIPQPPGAKLTVPRRLPHRNLGGRFPHPALHAARARAQRCILADSEPPPLAPSLSFHPRATSRRSSSKACYQPYGLAYHDGYLYVGESDSVKRYPYDSKAMTAGPGQEIISLKGIDRYHWTRNLLIDRAGKKLYVAVGSGSNDDTTEDPRRAAINRYNLDGTGHEFYARARATPWASTGIPRTDTLWAGVEERDTLGDDLPPDYLTHIQEGGFYGWPWAYTGPHIDPINKAKAPPALVAKTIVPDVLLGAHVAVLDFTFYTGSQFPAEYRGGAFVAEHGSWNRSQRDRLPGGLRPVPQRQALRPAQARGHRLDDSPGGMDVWGRPVAVLELPDGSLLISDDGGRKIWRLTYDGK